MKKAEKNKEIRHKMQKKGTFCATKIVFLSSNYKRYTRDEKNNPFTHHAADGPRLQVTGRAHEQSAGCSRH
jgi:hypothetical protein